jgi:acetyltransferase-like isoleucine patch superfamily enzyme
LTSLPHDWFPQPLPENVEIGEDSWLYSSYAFLHCHSTKKLAVRIGRSSGIYHGSFFDLGPDGEVHIGDYSALVGAIICTNQKLIIGDFAFIAHEVMLADNPVAIPPTDTAFPVSDASDSFIQDAGIVIGENVWIGARAVILGGARIGTGAVIGAATVVDFHVPDYAVVVGNPGRIVTHRPPVNWGSAGVRRDSPEP